MTYRVHVTIQSRGNPDGMLVLDLPPEQFDFLRTMADAWNAANPLHAQPFMRVQREVGSLPDQPDDICTYCGLTGHRASSCPKRKAVETPPVAPGMWWPTLAPENPASGPL